MFDPVIKQIDALDRIADSLEVLSHQQTCHLIEEHCDDIARYGDDAQILWRCDKCNGRHHRHGAVHYPYCPQCGRKAIDD